MYKTNSATQSRKTRAGLKGRLKQFLFSAICLVTLQSFAAAQTTPPDDTFPT